MTKAWRSIADWIACVKRKIVLRKFPDINASRKEAFAIRALAKGEATPQQQKAFMNWLVWKAAQTHADVFTPDNENVTNFLLGRRSVGLAFLRYVQTDPSTIEDSNG